MKFIFLVIFLFIFCIARSQSMPKQIQKEVQISIKLIPIIGYTYNPKKFFSYASYKKFPEMELYGSIIPKMDIFRKKNIIYIVVTEK